MEKLKKIFPISFKEKTDIGVLIVCIIIYLAVALIAGLVIGIFSGIPFLKVLFGIAGAVVEFYVAMGIILLVLDYLKIFK